jgi:hypothetical protein
MKYFGKHSLAVVVISFLALFTNYKLKLILFTKLFNFSIFKYQLDSVQKFNIFNAFSFIGVGHEGLIIYVTAIVLSRFSSQMGGELSLTIADITIIASINLVLAFAVSKK